MNARLGSFKRKTTHKLILPCKNITGFQLKMEIEFEENVWSVQNKAAQVGAFCFDKSFFLYEFFFFD